MKILIVPNSLKDCLPSREVADFMEQGIRRFMPDAAICKIPMADGGEGFVETLINAMGGRIIETFTQDPLMRQIKANWGILHNCNTAIIELAAASGLERLKKNERNPSITDTYGTGELIKAAMDKGCRKIILGIGGSATNDGGTGIARALGVKFLNKDGEEILTNGGNLDEIEKIDTTSLDYRLSHTEILIACDVKNPFTGPNGAAMIYSPQKGADKAMAVRLDNNLKHLAKVLLRELNSDIENTPGAGAAGGVGGGLSAILKAKLQPGFELIAQTVSLEEKVKTNDIIISAEGKTDGQTLEGKTPIGLARMAKQYDKPLFILTGNSSELNDHIYQEGVTAVIPIINKPMSHDEALRYAPILLENASEQLIRTFASNYKKPVSDRESE